MAETLGNSNEGSRSTAAPAPEFEQSRLAERSDSTDNGIASLKEKIKDDVATVKEGVQDVAHKASENAADVAKQQKSYAADQISKIAGALERVGAELKSDDASALGRYASDLGSSARQLAEEVKDKNFGEIAGIAEDFGRRRPLAFLGLAAVAGLAASRFLLASKSTPAATPFSDTSHQSDHTEKFNG